MPYSDKDLEHMSVCTSQYDSTCRSLASELLASRRQLRNIILNNLPHQAQARPRAERIGMQTVNNFDVLKRMTFENCDIRLATDIVRIDKVKAGTQVTMGICGDAVAQIAVGDLVPCLILYNKKQFNALKAKMEQDS